MTKQELAEKKRERRKQRGEGFAAVQEPRQIVKTRNSRRGMNDLLRAMSGLDQSGLTALLTSMRRKLKGQGVEDAEGVEAEHEAEQEPVQGEQVTQA